jgi:putative transposase
MFGSLLAAEQVEEIRSATNGGYVLGSAAFKRAVSRTIGRRVEKGSAGRPARVTSDKKQLDLL